MTMETIVSQQWLAEHLHDPNVVVVDCRSNLANPEEGRESYERDHIEGAFFLDMNRDLSGPVREHGGRHPLPDLGELSLRFGAIGIGAGVKVVAYDDQGGCYAARLWWLLQLLNHKEAYILDNGYSRWKSSGLPVSSDIPQPEARQFAPKVQRHLLASIDEVRDKLGKPGTVLVDSRDINRYLGLEETIDPVAGHIPGARNFFWKKALDENGAWRSAAEQAERFASLNKDDEIIVYCGSGVTACPNVLSLQAAGFPKVKLYSGSWSDWVSYPENPIATGEEK